MVYEWPDPYLKIVKETFLDFCPILHTKVILFIQLSNLSLPTPLPLTHTYIWFYRNISILIQKES